MGRSLGKMQMPGRQEDVVPGWVNGLSEAENAAIGRADIAAGRSFTAEQVAGWILHDHPLTHYANGRPVDRKPDLKR